MTYKRQVISLNNLLLDTENARHGKQDDQNAALMWMASQPKTLSLARSIAERGTNPSEVLVVMPASGGLYTVLEGNRRTAVLKMLQDPEKCPDERVRKQFRKLRQEMKVPLPTEMECVVYPDLESAAPWIETRHLGEQEGAGTVPWGAKEVEFFHRRLGERGPNAAGMKLIEYAAGKGLITQGEADVVALTNVTRLVNSPDVRREIGMSLRLGEPLLISEVEYFDRALTGMLRALASREVTVSGLKSREQRKGFIKDIKRKQGLSSYEVREETPLSAVATGLMNSPSSGGTATEANQEKADEKRSRTSRDPSSRKTAISSRTHMKIVTPKMICLFRELREINVDEFPHAAAVLTRVFVEVCCDLYIKKFNLSLNNVKNLADKVARVRQHIIGANSGNPDVKDDLKGLEVFAGDHDSIGSANSFNAVVHSANFRISPQELKVTWDRLEPCLPWFEGHV